MQTKDRMNERVCFIGGAGHSGSTLVGMVLGSHSDCFYAGEAAKTRFLHNTKKDLRKRVCKLCGPACPIWNDFHVDKEPDLYEQISRKTGFATIIDSTKNLDWISSHVRELEQTTAVPHLIYLKRDGRAVFNSRVRKYPDKDPVEHIERWMDQLRKTQAFFDSFQHPKTILRYEEFATAPLTLTRRLCNFLGLELKPEMVEFYRHEHHPLGGNNGTQFLVARHQGPNPERPYSKVGERSIEYYESHDSGIRLDLRWQQELDSELLALFESMAGEVNESIRWESE